METTQDRVIKICQIGAGLIGRERIKAVMALVASRGGVELTSVFDPYLKEKPAALQPYDLRFAGSMDEVFAQKPDWVFISTPHDTAAALAKQVLARDINVLLEKPMGRNLTEAKAIAACQVRPNQIFVGCNYRYFDGVTAALRDAGKKLFGNIISVEMILGHGGSPNDRTSWKLDPEKAGGGVLIDPGIHLLDLCQCLFPEEIQVKHVVAWRGFWNTGIEEEAHVLMQSGRSLINLQLSVVKWRSSFKIQINGDEGYGIIEGRGRSYGRQTYRRGRRWGWASGQSQKESEEVVVATDGDDVFQKEVNALLFGDPHDSVRPCTGAEALAGMDLLERCRRLAPGN